MFLIYYVDHNITFREHFISSVPRVVLLHASFMPSATANHKHCTTNRTCASRCRRDPACRSGREYETKAILVVDATGIAYRPRIRNQSVHGQRIPFLDLPPKLEDDVIFQIWRTSNKLEDSRQDARLDRLPGRKKHNSKSQIETPNQRTGQQNQFFIAFIVLELRIHRNICYLPAIPVPDRRYQGLRQQIRLGIVNQ